MYVVDNLPLEGEQFDQDLGVSGRCSQNFRNLRDSKQAQVSKYSHVSYRHDLLIIFTRVRQRPYKVRIDREKVKNEDSAQIMNGDPFEALFILLEELVPLLFRLILLKFALFAAPAAAKHAADPATVVDFGWVRLEKD